MAYLSEIASKEKHGFAKKLMEKKERKAEEERKRKIREERRKEEDKIIYEIKEIVESGNPDYVPYLINGLKIGGRVRDNALKALEYFATEHADKRAYQTLMLEEQKAARFAAEKKAEYEAKRVEYQKEQTEYAKKAMEYAQEQAEYAREEMEYAQEQAEYAREARERAEKEPGFIESMMGAWKEAQEEERQRNIIRDGVKKALYERDLGFK